MITIESNLIPPDVLADMERAMQLALSSTHDPEFERRIQDHAEQIRQEVRRKHGLLDIGVPAIRELRDSYCETAPSTGNHSL